MDSNYRRGFKYIFLTVIQSFSITKLLKVEQSPNTPVTSSRRSCTKASQIPSLWFDAWE